MAMCFTREQEEAIFTRGCDLLVAAAAGSGKTAVLVERIIQMITDDKKPISIDRLLVVTFTDAAASEMRQRIAKAISDRLQVTPADENLKKQMILLNRASITTIHSFCLRVIRRNFHKIDIEPNFRVADPVEINLLKTETLETLFEELYQPDNIELFRQIFGKETNHDFLRLVECYGGRVKDEELGKLVLEIEAFVSANPLPEKWLRDFADEFCLEGKSLDATIWAALLKKDTQMKLEGLISRMGRFIEKMKRQEAPGDFLDLLYSDYELLQILLKSAQSDFNRMYGDFTALTEKFRAIPRSKEITAELKEEIQAFREANFKEPLKEIREKVFFHPPARIKEDMAGMYGLIDALSRLVIAFSKVFSAAKKERAIADFNDFEHFALKILVDIESLEQNKILFTKEAEEYQEKYEEVLIDEYQDSNLIQEIILSAVSRNSRGTPNRFMVGDIKQSIYRFRQANPELFAEKYAAYSQTQEGLRRRIDLSKNFRSCASILSGINFIFKQIMTRFLGEVDYDEKACLYYGASYPELINTDDRKIEIHLLDREKKGRKEEREEEAAERDGEEEVIEELGKAELEAKMVASSIRNFMDSLYVTDSKTGERRRVEFRDIVILMRAVSAVSEVYLNEMKNLNIPAFAGSSKGYFESLEVMTVLSFLQIIDNPRQDLHLIAVLYSPIFDLTADELVEIRDGDKTVPFYEKVLQYNSNTALAEKLSRFTALLGKYRRIAVYTAINELIWLIYEETEYYNYVGAYAGGSIRQANLDVLIERAVEFEKTSYKGLFHFIRYIEKLQKNSTEQGDAKVVSETENLVKLMSIHKSKGLEFPVVFVCGLGTGFNKRDLSKNLILHQKYGFGPKYIDEENRISYSTVARCALINELARENLSEELRVLYVALTRAKEKLILTGCVNSFEKSLAGWSEWIPQKELEISAYALLKSRNFLDFIMPALLRHKSLEHIWKEENYSYNRELYEDAADFALFVRLRTELANAERSKRTEAAKKAERLARLAEETSEGETYSMVKKNLEWVYSSVRTSAIPSKISVSEIKRQHYKDIRLAFETPEFLLKTKDDLSSAQKGTVFHTVIEHLDLERDKTEENIRVLLNQLVERNIIDEMEVLTVSTQKIFRFLQSGLASRIRKSGFVKREAAFVVGVPASEIAEEEAGRGDEIILVHGVIDCFFEEEGEIVLVDYKTDRVFDKSEIVERYKGQLMIYKKAIEQSLGKRVKQSLLYLFDTGEEAEV